MTVVGALHRRTVCKTRKISPHGIEDTSNAIGAYMIMRADSHEAAAKLSFYDLSRRVRGDHADSADTRRFLRNGPTPWAFVLWSGGG